jgi:hypothetical protein
MLICELHKKRKYLPETLFYALGLLDRYLSRAIRTDSQKSLDLVILGGVCLFLAAKLQQPLSPSISQLCLLLESNFEVNSLSKLSCRQQVLDLEFHVVNFLEFDLQVQTPFTFLGRFLVIFLPNMKSVSQSKSIEDTTTQFCKFTAYSAEFLDYKPSHIAAAATLLTLNICASEALVSINVSVEPFEHIVKLKRHTDKTDQKSHPLSLWTPTVEQLTKIMRFEIEPIYISLLSQVNE